MRYKSNNQPTLPVYYSTYSLFISIFLYSCQGYIPDNETKNNIVTSSLDASENSGIDNTNGANVSMTHRANPVVTNIAYFYENPSTITTSLSLTVTNANATKNNLSCVIITEPQSEVPTNQPGAERQYNIATNALNAGSAATGIYGNVCSLLNQKYCKCPPVFNSTLVNNAGNWDIFYTKNQVIIWVNMDPNPPYNSAFTILDVPPAP